MFLDISMCRLQNPNKWPTHPPTPTTDPRDIRTLEEDPGAAMEFARSKSEARKEGLTGVEFADVAGLGPILNEVVEVVEVRESAQPRVRGFSCVR